FCHAQDTLMTAQSEILIGELLVKLFKRFSQQLCQEEK
ncbi:PTS lactose/cellobiose transporter subunit IIA, partial [Enterococcus faecalis]